MRSQRVSELLQGVLEDQPTSPGLEAKVWAAIERARRVRRRRDRLKAIRQSPILYVGAALVAILILTGAIAIPRSHLGSKVATPPTPVVLAASIPRLLSDVRADDPARPAIERVSHAGVMHGYGDGAFGPDDPTLRLQMAAISVRASGLALGSDDLSSDDELRRSYETLIALNLVSGSYASTDEVLQIQTISFIARAMVEANRWSPETIDDPAIYPNVRVSARDRLDLVTYVRNAGPLPGLPTVQVWPDFNQVAPRGWVAQVVAQALPRAAFVPLPAAPAMIANLRSREREEE